MKIIDDPEIKEDHVIERAFITDEGYHGVCKMNSMGFRCGYVGVDKTHPLYENEFSDLNAHGGITWHALTDGLWYIGFDCGHALDSPDLEVMHKYGFTAEFHGTMWSEATVKDLPFVIEQVKLLSKQMTPAALMQRQLQNS